MLNKMLYLTKMSVISILLLCGARQVAGADVSLAVTSKAKATAIPTFHCIGLYWTPEKGGAADKRVVVQFRKINGQWRDGLSMKYNPVKTSLCGADYRGSLVNLTPNTEYEIVLELEGAGLRTVLKVKTWNEEFPIAETIKGSDIPSSLVVTKSGTPEGYILYDGTGKTIDCGNKHNVGIMIEANYVIIRGYTIRNTKDNGIEIRRKMKLHHIVIEDCDISKWGTAKNTGFGKDMQSGVYCHNKLVHNIIVQRCKIHHPNTDSNSWAEKNRTFHPEGPQGIAFYESAGYHVIRYNEIWSDKDHYFNDVIGCWSNRSWRGFPGPDSDVYCNYFANSWDDGMEIEGGGRNVRVWNNYVENVFLPIGNAANSIGPTYFWRNVSGRTFSPKGSKYGTLASFFKMGYAGKKKWMSGHFYCFNNTILQPKDEGAGGFGCGKPLKHCTTRNNIIHVRKGSRSCMGQHYNGGDNDLDYDMFSGKRYPKNDKQLTAYNMVSKERLPKKTQEPNAIEATPKYTEGFGFNFETKTGNFQLVEGSSGHDQGAVIPNFSEGYKGKAPDMGAHEAGTPPMQYGVKANFVPAGGDK